MLIRLLFVLFFVNRISIEGNQRHPETAEIQQINIGKCVIVV